jgi:hypothetical protein
LSATSPRIITRDGVRIRQRVDPFHRFADARDEVGPSSGPLSSPFTATSNSASALRSVERTVGEPRANHLVFTFRLTWLSLVTVFHPGASSATAASSSSEISLFTALA